MTSKNVPTNQVLDDLFAAVEGGETDKNEHIPTTEPDKATAPTPTDADDDVFADLKSQLNVPSRSSTPRIPSSTTSAQKNTPTSSDSARSSEEKGAAKVAADSDSRASQPPQSSSSSAPKGPDTSAAAVGKGGGWWGGLSNLSTFATSAVKQAQGAVEQLQKNEDAQKWVEQAKGNYGLLRGLGKINQVGN